jgi:hypothetical protein
MLVRGGTWNAGGEKDDIDAVSIIRPPPPTCRRFFLPGCSSVLKRKQQVVPEGNAVAQPISAVSVGAEAPSQDGRGTNGADA